MTVRAFAWIFLAASPAVLLGQTSSYRILHPPHASKAYAKALGQAEPGLRGSSNLFPTVGGHGYTVEMGKGALSLVVPVASVPGEIPIPLTFRFNATRAIPTVICGTYQTGVSGMVAGQPSTGGTADSGTVGPLLGGGSGGYFASFLNLNRPIFGSVDFGFISSTDMQYIPGTDNEYPGKLARFSPTTYYVLEDGQVHSVMDFSTMTGTFSLPPMFGFAAKAASAVSIDTSGTLVTYPAVAADLGSWSSNVIAPSGFTTGSHTGYQVVMDRDRARVYAYASELYAWVPVLWVDRFGHGVTFKWQNFTTGLPTGFAAVRTVTATNHRGKGLQVQWAEPTAGSSAPEQILLRADFINTQAPSLQVKGYDGLATGGYQSMLPFAGGPVLRPTQLEIGNPSMPLPSPNWTQLQAPGQVLNPEPWPAHDQFWSFTYGSATNPKDQLATFTDDLGLDTSVAWIGTSIVDPNASGQPAGYPLDIYDSVQSLSATDSGVTLNQAFTWNLPTTVTSPSWATTYQKTYSGSQAWNGVAIATVGNPTYTYNFYPPSDTRFGNGAVQSIQTSVGSTVWSTQNFTYVNGVGTNGSANAWQSISTSTVGAPPSGQNIALDGATGSILTLDRGMGNDADLITYTYDRHPEYLDPNRCIKSIDENYYNGTLVSSRQTNTTYDPTSFLPTLVTNGAAAGVIGSQFTYFTASGNTKGHLQTVVPYASGASFSAPPSGGERTTTYTLDPISALPTKVATAYDGPPGYTNSIAQTGYGYDSEDRATAYVDGLGASVTVSYDGRGRVVGQTHSGQPSVAISYPTELQVVASRPGQTDTTNLCAFGLMTTRTRGADGVTETYSYDGNGRVVTVQEVSPAGHSRTRSNTWDALGRITQAIPIRGPEVNYAYSVDSLGNQNVGASYPGQPFTTSQSLDLWGRVVSSTDRNGTVVTRAFDAYGRPTSVVTTPSGGTAQTRTYTYTDWGVATRQDPETGLTTFGSQLYNVLGLPNAIVENDGRCRNLTYDGLGRVRTVSSGADANIYNYNGLFLVNASATSLNQTGSVVYTPDSFGRVSQEAITYPGAGTAQTIAYTYDPAAGRLGSITYPDPVQTVVGYSYDDVASYGRVTKVTVGGQTLASVGYDPEGWGQLGAVNFNGPGGSGALDSWDYSNDGAQINTETISIPGQSAITRTYKYDNLNHLTQAGEWDTLAHDSLGQLTKASGMGDSVTLAHDGFGNNIKSDAGGATGFNNFTFNPFASDQTPIQIVGGAATGWTYDGDGEAKTIGSAVGASAPDFAFTWDQLGRLSTTTLGGATQTYAYLPSGMRLQLLDPVKPANNRRFAYTSSGLMLSEFTGSGSSWTWKGNVVYLGSLAIAEIDGNGTHELHSDHLGTPIIVTSRSASGIQGSQLYGPYGETIPSVYPTGYVPMTGYTGHVQTDPVPGNPSGSVPPGLIYMRGRFYSPAWHRFVNSDHGADQNQLNQMAYAGGSPMMNTDPSGLMRPAPVGIDYAHLWGNLVSYGDGESFSMNGGFYATDGNLYAQLMGAPPEGVPVYGAMAQTGQGGSGSSAGYGYGNIQGINIPDSAGPPPSPYAIWVPAASVGVVGGTQPDSYEAGYWSDPGAPNTFTIAGPTLSNGTPIIGYDCGGKTAWQKFKEGYGNASFLGLGSPVVDDGVGIASGVAGGAAMTAGAMATQGAAVAGPYSLAAGNAAALGAVTPWGFALCISVPAGKALAGVFNIFNDAY